MEIDKETIQEQLTRKDKLILFSVGSFAAVIGTIFGIIAYYQQWLG